MMNRITSSHITELADNEIFVFGSNVQGKHIGGAAHQAHKYFGAEWGNGEGIQGQSYAIPTVNGYLGAGIREFIDYAREHPELHFLVTEVGCGIAGYTPEIVAPFFFDAMDVANIALPERFWTELEHIRLRYRYGDPFVKCLDEVNHILGKHYNLDNIRLNTKGLFENSSYESKSIKPLAPVEIFEHFVKEGYSLWLCSLLYLDERCGLNNPMRVHDLCDSFKSYLSLLQNEALNRIDERVRNDVASEIKQLIDNSANRGANEYLLLHSLITRFTEVALILNRPSLPVYNSYRVSDRFYVGEYPRYEDEEASKERIKTMLDFGITDFIDLTRKGELSRSEKVLLPYSHLLPNGIGHYRFPMTCNCAPNFGPSKAVSKINALLKAGHTVYLHCRSGVGRSSIVVMQWLLKQSKNHKSDNPFLQFYLLWRYFPKAKTQCPFSKEQKQFVEELIRNKQG